MILFICNCDYIQSYSNDHVTDTRALTSYWNYFTTVINTRMDIDSKCQINKHEIGYFLYLIFMRFIITNYVSHLYLPFQYIWHLCDSDYPISALPAAQVSNLYSYKDFTSASYKYDTKC